MDLSLSKLHDRALVERLLTGDQEAMIVLFDRYSHLVYSFALKSAGTPELAEEILHDVFLQLWRMPGQCQTIPGSGVAAWLKDRVRLAQGDEIVASGKAPLILEATGLEVFELDDGAFTGRRSRVHNASAQLAAMQMLAQAFVESPETIMQALVDSAVNICGAQSAGISIQNRQQDGEISYHWIATAGKYKRFANAMLPSFPSACGVCLERGRPQFFRVSRAFFDLMKIEAEIVTDGLLIPWNVEETRGTIWVMSHDREEVFDKNDCTMLVLLANFAAMGIRHQRRQGDRISQARAGGAADMARHLAHVSNNPFQILTSSVYLAGKNQGSIDDCRLAQELSGPLERLKHLVASLLAQPD